MAQAPGGSNPNRRAGIGSRVTTNSITAAPAATDANAVLRVRSVSRSEVPAR
jgi:hypothetical protein